MTFAEMYPTAEAYRSHVAECLRVNRRDLGTMPAGVRAEQTILTAFRMQVEAGLCAERIMHCHDGWARAFLSTKV